MYSLFNKLNSYIINSPRPSNDGDFHIIFCNKFKNLLDDYIINYFTKYLFYFLFISFWILEIYSFFFANAQILMQFGIRYFKIYSIPTISGVESVVNSELASYPYYFFKFNLDIVNYVFHLLAGESHLLILIVFIFLFIVLLLFEFYTHLKQVSILTLFSIYLSFSLVVFFFFQLGLFNFEYAFILMVFIPFLLTISQTKKIETLDLCIMSTIIFVSFIHPIFILFFLLGISYLFKDFLLSAYRSEIGNKMSESDFSGITMSLIIDVVFLLVIIGAVYPVINAGSGALIATFFILFFFMKDYAYSFFINKK